MLYCITQRRRYIFLLCGLFGAFQTNGPEQKWILCRFNLVPKKEFPITQHYPRVVKFGYAAVNKYNETNLTFCLGISIEVQRKQQIPYILSIWTAAL